MVFDKFRIPNLITPNVSIAQLLKTENETK